MTQPRSGMEEAEVLREYVACAREAMWAKPRRFMEGLLKVQDENGQLVPFKFRPNQVYYNAKTFGGLASYDEPMDVFTVKSRKAVYTTYVKGAMATFLFCTPGFHAISVADSDDTFKATNQMIDRFYDNLPGVVQGSIKKKHWDESFKEIAWGGISSSITMSSSRSPNFARGFTPKMGDYDEAGLYQPGFEARVYTSTENSFPPNRWIFKGGTPGGTESRFYRDFAALKKGEWDAIYLFRAWYDSPEAYLGEGHRLARPEDRGGVVPGRAGGQIGEQDETALMGRLDPERWAGQLRMRRAWIAEARRTYGDDALAYAAFLVEHAENDLSCWSNLGNPQFDPLMLNYMANSMRRPVSESIVSGMNRRVWEHPVAGHLYVAGMDFATPGKRHDAITLQMFDATERTFVAELWSKSTGIMASMREAIQMCREYNNALFVPEVNTVGATVTDEARLMYEYPTVYRRPRRSGENVDTDSYRNREWGWKATEDSVRELWAVLQERFNSGGVHIPNEYLSQEIRGYDPQRDEHWPDRMRAAAIVILVAVERKMMGADVQAQAKAQSRGLLVLPGPRRPYFAGG